MRFSRILHLTAAAAVAAACGDDGPSNVEPTAAFTAQCEPFTCSFTNLSTDADGTLDRYAWDFGDGGTAATRNVTHIYETPGRYTVTLRVTDDVGAIATASEQVDVAGNGAPTAAFTVSCTGNTCAFTDRSFDPDATGEVMSYEWNFGDNSAHVTTRDASHTYGASGHFTVRLTVRDDRGGTGTATAQASPNFTPTAVFTVLCTNLTCEFTNFSADSGGAVATYEWDFGDEQTSDVREPEHTYQAQGPYLVALRVTDNMGASETRAVEIQVRPPEFTVTCSSLECTFRSGDGFPNLNFWDFGDGETGEGSQPTHVYAVTEPTTFTVALTIMDADFQPYRATQEITVSP